MKGIILAGGYATRLRPATVVVGKSLLPIYNKPMIYYGISLLIESGIDEIIITCNQGDEIFYKRLFENRFDGFGVKIRIVPEEKPKGPAYGIYTAKEFCKDDDVIAMFSDNVFLSNELPNIIRKARQNLKGVTVFAKEVDDPHRFGIIELDSNDNMLSMEEKPKNPKTNLAATGLMLFTKDVFNQIENLTPSKRGEYETTDLINRYMNENRANCVVLGNDVMWLDTGTHDSLFECSLQVKEFEREFGLIGCPEVSVFRAGKISTTELDCLTQNYPINYKNEILRAINL